MLKGNRPLERPRGKRENNIKMGLKDTMWDYNLNSSG
jgi:hypothetical protein